MQRFIVLGIRKLYRNNLKIQLLKHDNLCCVIGGEKIYIFIKINRLSIRIKSIRELLKFYHVTVMRWVVVTQVPM